MFTRRESLLLLGAGSVVVMFGTDEAQAKPMSLTAAIPPDRAWLGMLSKNMETESDYMPVVEGELPSGLAGTVYRNGPGLFERNGYKKATLLDGDGMIRALSIGAQSVRFRNRFVRTAKYEQESKAGRFMHPTWTTLAPNRLENIPGLPSLSQAGVAPVVKQGQLYAFDEVGLPYCMDATSLETFGQAEPCGSPAMRSGSINYKAHTKTDGRTGAWVLIGGHSGRNPDLHVLINDARGTQIAHASAPNPRDQYTYYHDFFWAGQLAVFNMHPAFLSPLPVLLGERSFADCLTWRPEEGSVLVIVDPSGEKSPINVEVPAAWMWHSANAFVSGNTLVADFMGYDAPDHFLGPNAVMRTVMQGREGTAIHPGTLRRYTVDLVTKRGRLEAIADGHFEFPVIHPSRVGQRHRYVYAASGELAKGWFHNGIARIDTESGACVKYHFGPDKCAGEPVFAPDPGVDPSDPAVETSGWLLTEVLDGATGKSFIAVFNAASIESGPVAKVHLNHHLPMGFHGWWEPA